jgi:hypothetical protein
MQNGARTFIEKVQLYPWPKLTNDTQKYFENLTDKSIQRLLRHYQATDLNALAIEEVHSIIKAALNLKKSMQFYLTHAQFSAMLSSEKDLSTLAYCKISMLACLPNNTDDYRNSYILLRPNLYLDKTVNVLFIRLDGTIESVPILNMEKFIQDFFHIIEKHTKKPKNVLLAVPNNFSCDLSPAEVSALITTNGSHSPIKYNIFEKAMAHFKKNEFHINMACIINFGTDNAKLYTAILALLTLQSHAAVLDINLRRLLNTSTKNFLETNNKLEKLQTKRALLVDSTQINSKCISAKIFFGKLAKDENALSAIEAEINQIKIFDENYKNFLQVVRMAAVERFKQPAASSEEIELRVKLARKIYVYLTQTLSSSSRDELKQQIFSELIEKTDPLMQHYKDKIHALTQSNATQKMLAFISIISAWEKSNAVGLATLRLSEKITLMIDEHPLLYKEILKEPLPKINRLGQRETWNETHIDIFFATIFPKHKILLSGRELKQEAHKGALKKLLAADIPIFYVSPGKREDFHLKFMNLFSQHFSEENLRLLGTLARHNIELSHKTVSLTCSP